MRLYNSRVAPKSKGVVSLGEEKRQGEICGEAELGMMGLQPWAGQGVPASSRGWGRSRDEILPASLLRESSPSDPLIVGPPASKTVKNKFLSFHTTKFVVIGDSNPRKLYTHPQAAQPLILRTVPGDKQKGHEKAKCVTGPLSNTQSRLQRKRK